MRRPSRAIVIAGAAAIASSVCSWADLTAGSPGNLQLRIAYPGIGDRLPYLEKSFVFGSVTPGASVAVNGYAALVAGSGGWIAYLPFSPGRFALRAVARRASEVASAECVVDVARPLRALPRYPARVDESVAPFPAQSMTLRAGDRITLLVKASPHAHVTAAFGQKERSVTLLETSEPSFVPSDAQRMLGGLVASGAAVDGFYRKRLKLDRPIGTTLHVRYLISAADGSVARVTAKGSLTVQPSSWYRVGSVVLEDRRKNIDARPYGVIQSSPDGDWRLFLPAGMPLEVTGASGDWYRVALGTLESGWIEKRFLRVSPPGTPKPWATLLGLRSTDETGTSTVVIHLSERVPYSIDESLAGPRLDVRLYGTSFARALPEPPHAAGIVRRVKQLLTVDGVARFELLLGEGALWGYHAHWQGNDLVLSIKKPPLFAPAPQSALRGMLVVIDPGHSPDSGSIGPLGTQERDVNLAIAKRLAIHLNGLGARTALTRTSNEAVGLYERTALAQRLHANLLVSVHNNALPDGVNPFTHHGYSVYYYQPQSLALAQAIHDAYRLDTSLPDYGLYRDNLALARPTEEPAVLTESAFIMWPPEEMKLRNPLFVDSLAAAIADGISRWASSAREGELTARRHLKSDLLYR